MHPGGLMSMGTVMLKEAKKMEHDWFWWHCPINSKRRTNSDLSKFLATLSLVQTTLWNCSFQQSGNFIPSKEQRFHIYPSKDEITPFFQLPHLSISYLWHSVPSKNTRLVHFHTLDASVRWPLPSTSQAPSPEPLGVLAHWFCWETSAEHQCLWAVSPPVPPAPAFLCPWCHRGKFLSFLRRGDVEGGGPCLQKKETIIPSSVWC